jgi:2-isopropylmalate synthase
MERVRVYDTTLRDGTQGEGVAFSLEDKLLLAARFGEFGIDYIEGGFPGSNPKDAGFFEAIRERPPTGARIAAFGATRKAANAVQDDPTVKALLDSAAPAATIVAKSWDFHVTQVLNVSLDENLAMIDDTVRHLKAAGREVILDAEHFFDGYKANRAYALRSLEAAAAAGADCLCLCDTNGGTLPQEVFAIVTDVRAALKAPIGIHCHNDSGTAVAATLAAVEAGAAHVQGTMNGLGERCGNADLCVVVPGLVLKMKREVTCAKNLVRLTELSRFVYEIANMNFQANQPYVGLSAFAHKGGFHVHAVQRDARTYEHVDPCAVGNERRVLISELSGSSNILAKTEKHHVSHDKGLTRRILAEVTRLENEGYQFEAAEASFDLLVRRLMGRRRAFFALHDWHVTSERRGTDPAPFTTATVKLSVDGQERLTVAEGNGPVNALDGALRKALADFYPVLSAIRLTDFKVRVVNARAGTTARVRVVIESTDGEEVWGTVGVSENIIEASWQAMVDSVEYKLTKEEDKKAAETQRPRGAS